MIISLFGYQLNVVSPSRGIAQVIPTEGTTPGQTSDLEIDDVTRVNLLVETADEIIELLEVEYNLEIDRNDPYIKRRIRSFARGYKNFLRIVADFSKKAPDVIAVREMYWLFKWVVVAPTLGSILGKVGMAWTIPLMWNTILSTKIVAYFYWILREKVRSLYGIKKYGYTLHTLEKAINKVWSEDKSKGFTVVERDTYKGHISFKIQTSILDKIKSALGGKTVTVHHLEKIINDSTYISIAKRYAGDTNLYSQILISKILTDFDKTDELFSYIPKRAAISPSSHQHLLLNLRDTISKAFSVIKYREFEYHIFSIHDFWHFRDENYRFIKLLKSEINKRLYQEIRFLQKLRYTLAQSLIEKSEIDTRRYQDQIERSLKHIESYEANMIAFEEFLHSIDISSTSDLKKEKVKESILNWLKSDAPDYLKPHTRYHCNNLFKFFF